MSYRFLECRMIKNPCWVKYHNAAILPTGITVHSTDKAGRILRRFVQPADGQTVGLMDGDRKISAEQMLTILGKNNNANDWNRPTVNGKPVEKAVHAFLGTLADGSYAVCKCLEYTQPVWAASKGPNGSYDGRVWTDSGQTAGGLLHVQFEMIEDSAGDQAHCHNLYWLAVQYCADLCRQFPTIRLENIVSHKEANARGMASGHGDPEDYWARCGMEYTMDGFRADVASLLQQSEPEPEPEPAGYLDFPDVSEEDWFAGALAWAVEKGIVLRSGKPFNPENPMDKATALVLLRRAYNAIVKEIRDGGAAP